MINPIVENLTEQLDLKTAQIRQTVELLEGGATVPFIARYRKEKTGNLDEIQVRHIQERLQYFQQLESRKETILKTISELGKHSPDLEKQIKACQDKVKLEDIYLPYKPKKLTRATKAKEKGLLPLADLIFRQQPTGATKQSLVGPFIDAEKNVMSYEEEVAGAQDIMAERIADESAIRDRIRRHTQSKGMLTSTVKKAWKEKESKFKDYYDFSEPIHQSPSHRILAIRRGTNENILSWRLEIEQAALLHFMNATIITDLDGLFHDELKTTVEDAYKRLLFPSIEKEVFNAIVEKAEQEAIAVFAKNLRNLLLSAPAGPKIIMGIDPGFRSGCKVAVIDKNGAYQEFVAIFPHAPQHHKELAEKKLLHLIAQYKVELIAIGNGTASKETDRFVKGLIQANQLAVKAVVVSEAGASVYSASPGAALEFPDLDLTVRGAISIARRLQDPLAELVKVDPKAIGVGQYQHDVNQKQLKSSLDQTVESCVNFVGVDVNTASQELLSYVSGINRSLATNIVNFRREQGSFKNRSLLKQVPQLGEKAFEQCTGFLRIKNSPNPLDDSSIHPETYDLVKKMASDSQIPLREIVGNTALLRKIDLNRYVTSDFGLPTLTDIVEELKKPGVDPRESFDSPEFSPDINDLEDLREDMILPGVVTNVTNFGAFVDIGVHQDGLIHISKLAHTFVKNPHDFVAVGDHVQTKVLSVDLALKRISLERVDR